MVYLVSGNHLAMMRAEVGLGVERTREENSSQRTRATEH